jgi:hypothetical protein
MPFVKLPCYRPWDRKSFLARTPRRSALTRAAGHGFPGEGHTLDGLSPCRQQAVADQEDIRERTGDEQSMRILGEAAIPYFREAKDAPIPSHRCSITSI